MRRRLLFVVGVVLISMCLLTGCGVDSTASGSVYITEDNTDVNDEESSEDVKEDENIERLEDNIDYEFVADSQVLGMWYSVDFVEEISDFDPENKQFSGDLYLENMNFLYDGELQVNDESDKPWFFWTKGVVTHNNDKTASAYSIMNINGNDYLFFEWKSGDYTIDHDDPQYYVLSRGGIVDNTEVNQEQEEHNDEEVLEEQEEQNVNEETGNNVESGTVRIEDNIDYEFVNDEDIIGNWLSIDFVDTIDEFNPASRASTGELFLQNIHFLENGELMMNEAFSQPWLFWTKGIVTHSGDKTASEYIIMTIEGNEYLFYQWKSGDYILHGQEPGYYVLVRE